MRQSRPSFTPQSVPKTLTTDSPGHELLAICERVANLYLIEHAPIDRDVVYTESMPLRHEGLKLFKAGVNIFYPSAHRTRNHDRRIPGGLMISVNSPGHWANSLIKRKLAGDLDAAVEQAMDLALRSIGNGGIGHVGGSSASWHNIEVCPHATAQRREGSKLPRYVPIGHSQRSYSALYHTDVLVPTDVTIDGTLDPDRMAAEVWPDLVLDYISSQERAHDHINHALFRGQPIAEEAVFHNPWPPRRATNHPLDQGNQSSSLSTEMTDLTTFNHAKATSNGDDPVQPPALNVMIPANNACSRHLDIAGIAGAS